MKEMTGFSPIQYYHDKDLGFLNQNLVAVHCVWLDDEDIRILGETGTSVSHNPMVNLYAAGIAPVPALLEAGINVSLGSDGAFQDYFEVLKTAAMIHKVPAKDSAVISADKILEMATIDGARALGMEDEIGSIEVGKKADLVVFDLNHANTMPALEPLSYLIVYQAKSHNVDTVIIDGKVVLDNKEFSAIDEDLILAKTHAIAARLFPPM
jgi:5-methylthioadenosine/S-adenosylhomocysteine deaminase